MRLNKNLTAALLGTALAVVAVGTASANPFNAWHPRRAEVNERLQRQDHRITRDYRDGSISARQADQLRREDHDIRDQERFYGRNDGSHISYGEQAQLNREENGTSRQIYGDAH